MHFPSIFSLINWSFHLGCQKFIDFLKRQFNLLIKNITILSKLLGLGSARGCNIHYVKLQVSAQCDSFGSFLCINLHWCKDWLFRFGATKTCSVLLNLTQIQFLFHSLNRKWELYSREETISMASEIAHTCKMPPQLLDSEFTRVRPSTSAGPKTTSRSTSTLQF